MRNSAIIAENISKQYRLGQVGTGTLRHDLNRFWYKIRGKEDPYLKIGESNDRSVKGTSDYVWSLKDINFEIEQGDAVGIIGRNGAGKSTLLKLLSKVTKPTTGSFKVNGRIASLLEVGTGFNPEMTGRENIFLNGAILGMRREEIRRKFDAIVDFSAVERYIDTPVKRYSSGMYVRLAFAVAAHLESEILLVDEVLSVGDVEFQKKCLGKMSDVSKGEGRTVLFVSHNLSAVRELCDKGLLLENGALKVNDNISDVIESYYRTTNETISLNKIKVTVKYEDDLAYWAVGTRIKIIIENLKAVKGNFLDITFYDKFGKRVFSIEGALAKVPLKLNEKIELIIINPGFVNSFLSMDIGLKEYSSGWYAYLETSVLQIPTVDLENSRSIKGLVLPEIYFKNEENSDQFRLLE
jgi:lipopolysaccharide transport system ATP-binding protein